MDVLNPSPGLLAKIGSIIIHARELLSPDGHVYDKVALDSAVNDEEVKQWIEGMDELSMLPRERSRDR